MEIHSVILLILPSLLRAGTTETVDGRVEMGDLDPRSHLHWQQGGKRSPYSGSVTDRTTANTGLERMIMVKEKQAANPQNSIQPERWIPGYLGVGKRVPVPWTGIVASPPPPSDNPIQAKKQIWSSQNPWLSQLAYQHALLDLRKRQVDTGEPRSQENQEVETDESQTEIEGLDKRASSYRFSMSPSLQDYFPHRESKSKRGNRVPMMGKRNGMLREYFRLY